MADEQITTPTAPGNVVWALADNLGTVRDLAVNNSQSGVTTVANHCVYDSFGNLQSQTNAAVDCIFGFVGQADDPATGLQNNLNRWYDAATARWVSQDPIDLNGGDPNTYRYCGNSPPNATDPTGTATLDEAAAAVTDFLNNLLQGSEALTGRALATVINEVIVAKILSSRGSIADGQTKDMTVTIPVGTIMGVAVTAPVTLQVTVTRQAVNKGGTTYHVSWHLDQSVTEGKLGSVKSLKQQFDAVAKAFELSGKALEARIRAKLKKDRQWFESRWHDFWNAPFDGTRLRDATTDALHLASDLFDTVTAPLKEVVTMFEGAMAVLFERAGVTSSNQTITGHLEATASLGGTSIATLTIPYNGGAEAAAAPTFKSITTDEAQAAIAKFLAPFVSLLPQLKDKLSALGDSLKTGLLSGNIQKALTDFEGGLKNILVAAGNVNLSLPLTVDFHFVADYDGNFFVPTKK